MKPFALTKPSQFRPGPPPALDSKEWAADYNEIKTHGGKASAARSAQQTETARFWLAVGPAPYHQLPRQLILSQKMDVVDGARLMALYAIALTDAYVAVFDAKYHYALWRPITAIRAAALRRTLPRLATPPGSRSTTMPMHRNTPARTASMPALRSGNQAVLGSKTIQKYQMNQRDGSRCHIAGPTLTHSATRFRTRAFGPVSSTVLDRSGHGHGTACRRACRTERDAANIAGCIVPGKR
jgi:hypothetical protein